MSRPRHYDQKQMFDAWMICGSATKASEYLYQQGVKSYNGNKPSPSSVLETSKQYIIEFPDISRIKLIARGGHRKKFENDEKWNHYLVATAFHVYRNRGASTTFYNWLHKNNLVDFAKNTKYLRPDIDISQYITQDA